MLHRLAASRAGNVLVVAAFSLPLVIGAVGLAIDVAGWQQSRRALQGAADSAVYSAAVASAAGASADRAREEARAVLSTYGLVNGANGVTITVSNPPTIGNYTANSNAWEVKVGKAQDLRFASLFLSAAPTVSVRAVAKAGSGGSGCILALSTTAAKAVNVTNNGQIANPNCVVYSNSADTKALSCSDNCSIKASTSVVGGISTYSNAAMTGAFNRTGQAPIADPYAAVDPGAAGGCTQTSAVTTATTLNPGHYCGGFNVSGSKTLTLNPGIYFVDSKFYFTNGAKLDATSGVTIVINGSYCIGLGDCAVGNGVGNNATINITAPTSGPTAGIAMMGPRTGADGKNQEFTNNSYLNVQGALYFPSQKLHFNDNSNMNSALCTQLIGSTVQIDNNANMSPNCTGTGVTPIGSGGSGSTGMLE
ncbi:pilus assembly protein TadG-related protein [Novosphingobium bradum]|uniref:Pilus assembly protein TadG-related protein n=1 Tax=Novosphingobium bradum TaxID=1737444 RepID=A0ABV7IN18_9SPHN